MFRMKYLAGAGAAAFLAVLSACGDGPTGSRPVPTHSPGDTITGTISRAGQVDTVKIETNASQQVGLYLQATSGAVQATLLTATGQPVASITAAAPAFEQGTESVQLGAQSTYMLLVSAAPGAAGGAYRVRVGFVTAEPERVARQFTAGDTIEGERLESDLDVDEFVFAGKKDSIYIVFLQAAGPGAGRLDAVVYQNDLKFAGGYVESRAGDAELEGQASGIFILPGDAEYRVKVSAPDFGDGPVFRGDYRLQVRRVNPGPESVSAQLVPGDTLAGEAIDHVGDFDEFTVAGAPGQRFNLFFQAEPGTVRGTLAMEAESGSYGLRGAESDGTRALLQNATGHVDARPGGTVRVRVSAPRHVTGIHRGRYRIFTYPVNPLPEHVPATLALGDSVVGERIDLPGDVDSFTVVVPRPVTAGLTLALVGPQGEAGIAAALGSVPSRISTIAFLDQPVNGAAVGGLAAGEQVLRVAGRDFGSGSRGAYRVRPYAIDFRPERIPASFAIGDVVEGEDLRPISDFDEFFFQATAGQELNFFLQGISGGAGGGLAAVVYGPDGGFVRSALSSFQSPALNARGTRFTAPQTGTYKVSVWPNNMGFLYADQGEYRFVVRPATRTPEHVSAAVAVGATVTGEALDYPSDVDVFTLTGAPGTRVRLSLRYAAPTPFVSVWAHNPGTGEPLAWALAEGEGSPELTIPAGGSVRLTVSELFTCGPVGSCDFKESGAYSFSVTQVAAGSRRP